VGWFALTTGIAVAMTPGPASADTKSCVASHASAQREAKAGRLRLAAQLYTACGSDETCPEQLRTECAELLEKVRSEQPTVSFSVLDENGKDVSNVRVFSTDELISEGLDGRAIAMDPGKHRLRFLLPWGDVLSNDVLIREGEKNRLVQVKIEKAMESAPAADAKTVTKAPPPAARRSERAGPPLAAWVMTGAAVAGASVFTTFALMGKSDKNELDNCAPACGPSSRAAFDSLKRSYLIADVGLGVAVVSTAIAAGFFLTGRDRVETRADSARFRLGLAARSDGGTLFLSRPLE
jgi:hypothetical protein